MITIVLILIVLVIIITMVKRKLIIRVDTFFRKGFPKHDEQYGIYCFTGKQGTGKTYSVVDFLGEKRTNQTILTNVRSYYNNHKNFCRYVTSFEEVMKICETEGYGEKFIIFYDELFKELEKTKISKEMRIFISQMRKRGLYLLTTAQEWLEINITFRRYVRFQIECNMKNIPLFNFAISTNVIKDAYQMKWDNLENEYVCPIIRTNIKKCGLKIANSYDTYETI